MRAGRAASSLDWLETRLLRARLADQRSFGGDVVVVVVRGERCGVLGGGLDGGVVVLSGGRCDVLTLAAASLSL